MNAKDLKVATDGEGFDVLLSCDEDGGYVSCGDSSYDVTAEQAEKIAGGEIAIIAELFDYNDFEAE